MRKLLLAVFCLSLTVIVYRGWLTAHGGSTGMTLQYSSGGTTIRVAPGSAAYRAGLRTGDSVDLGALPNTARYRLHEGVVAGERFVVPLRSGAGLRMVPLVAKPSMAGQIDWFIIAGTAWLVLFGALLAWRRSDNAPARTLALLLLSSPSLIMLQAENGFYTPWIGVDLAANALSSLTNLSTALLATYAMLFRLPHPSTRRTLAALAYASGIAWIAFTFIAMERAWIGLAPPPQARFVLIAASCLFSWLCALVTARQSTGEQRVRVAWVTASLGITYVVEVAYILARFIAPAFGVRFGEVALDVAYFLAPVGLWCSLLNRRVLDIGFALNRAAVFTGVSVVIVGIFVLVEWALSEWFSSASHTTNLAISAVLALALGLSVRAIHTRVDRVLDAVFFTKRHEDEQAIRTLAREAAYITDPQVLLSRIVAVLEEHADATSAQVLLDDGAGHYGGVSENDPAIVRLRATQKVLDLHDVQSAIAGEFAYPMLARGRLVGLLVLGPKRSGESYAPDESDAIAQLAHDAGAALDVLGTKAGVAHDNALVRLQESSEAILAGIRELPQRLAEILEMQEHA